MTRPDGSGAGGSDEQWQRLLPELRFGVRACAVGLVLAYALVYSLKWRGLMPEHLTWLGLTLAPAAMFGTLGSLFVGGRCLRERWWLFVVPVALVSLAVLAVLNLSGLGW